MSEWVSRVLHHAQQITGHFRLVSFQAINCTATHDPTQNNTKYAKTNG